MKFVLQYKASAMHYCSVNVLGQVFSSSYFTRYSASALSL